MSACETLIDEIAVERALEGDLTVSLTADELEYCWTQLELDGCTAEEIGDTLGVTRRTVVRWRGGEPVGRARKGRLDQEPAASNAAQARKALAARIVRLERELSEAKAQLQGMNKTRQYGPRPGGLPANMTAIRQWAKENGVWVMDKGRVSERVVRLYKAAQYGS